MKTEEQDYTAAVDEAARKHEHEYGKSNRSFKMGVAYARRNPEPRVMELIQEVEMLFTAPDAQCYSEQKVYVQKLLAAFKRKEG